MDSYVNYRLVNSEYWSVLGEKFPAFVVIIELTYVDWVTNMYLRYAVTHPLSGRMSVSYPLRQCDKTLTNDTHLSAH